MSDKLNLSDFTAEVSLTPEQITQACKEYVERQTNHVAKSARFIVSDTSDDRFNQFPSYNLTKAVVTVSIKQA